MENINVESGREPLDGIMCQTLCISCIDTIELKARATFDCEMFAGIQVTYWQGDDMDARASIDSIFDLLFEEVFKTREINQEKSVIN